MLTSGLTCKYLSSLQCSIAPLLLQVALKTFFLGFFKFDLKWNCNLFQQKMGSSIVTVKQHSELQVRSNISVNVPLLW